MNFMRICLNVLFLYLFRVGDSIVSHVSVCALSLIVTIVIAFVGERKDVLVHSPAPSYIWKFVCDVCFGVIMLPRVRDKMVYYVDRKYFIFETLLLSYVSCLVVLFQLNIGSVDIIEFNSQNISALGFRGRNGLNDLRWMCLCGLSSGFDCVLSSCFRNKFIYALASESFLGFVNLPEERYILCNRFNKLTIIFPLGVF